MINTEISYIFSTFGIFWSLDTAKVLFVLHRTALRRIKIRLNFPRFQCQWVFLKIVGGFFQRFHVNVRIWWSVKQVGQNLRRFNKTEIENVFVHIGLQFAAVEVFQTLYRNFNYQPKQLCVEHKIVMSFCLRFRP